MRGADPRAAMRTDKVVRQPRQCLVHSAGGYIRHARSWRLPLWLCSLQGNYAVGTRAPRPVPVRPATRNREGRQEQATALPQRTTAGTVPGRSTDGYSDREHTSELQSLMRISYAVFCLKQKKHKYINNKYSIQQLTHI